MSHAVRQIRQLAASGSRSRTFSTSTTSCARTLPRPIATRPASQRDTSIPRNIYELTKAYPRHPLLAFFNLSERTIKESPESTQTKEILIPSSLRSEDLTKTVFSRSWLAPELRTKSSLELHQLWYKCLMERNKVHTTLAELQRLGSTTLAVYNNFNGYKIDRRVRKTMARIKFVLNERRLALIEAQTEAGAESQVDAAPQEIYNEIDLLEEESDVVYEVAAPTPKT